VTLRVINIEDLLSYGSGFSFEGVRFMLHITDRAGPSSPSMRSSSWKPCMPWVDWAFIGTGPGPILVVLHSFGLFVSPK